MADIAGPEAQSSAAQGGESVPCRVQVGWSRVHTATSMWLV